MGHVSPLSKHSEMVIKLEMANIFDRFGNHFLYKVLKKIGFSNKTINNGLQVALTNPLLHSLVESRASPLSSCLYILKAEALDQSHKKRNNGIINSWNSHS